MKKLYINTIGLIFIVITLSGCPGTVDNTTSGGTGPAVSSDKAITAFTFPSSIGTTITEGTHTIVVRVPHKTVLTALVPSITITGVSVNPASGVGNNFTAAQTYTVTSPDTTTQDYTVSVVVNTTAILVYGSLTNTGNEGGISANSLASPTGVAVDAGGIYIADGNNRVLYYSGTSTTATRVYGQLGSFTSATANNGGVSANSLNNSLTISGVAVNAGGVYIVDSGNNRVLYYSGTSTTATRVYGQGSIFTTNTANNGGVSANSLNAPQGIAVDAGGVYIADNGNHRVLYFSGTSTTASRVYGQGGIYTTNTANNGGVSANSLNYPNGVAADAGGVYISDKGNNRALYYSGTNTTATRVYGQGGIYTTNTVNNGGISANSLNNPKGIAVDSSGVFIVGGNNRVLYYLGTSTTATRVYGQYGVFTTDDNFSYTDLDCLYDPSSVAVFGSDVYITHMNRVLKY